MSARRACLNAWEIYFIYRQIHNKRYYVDLVNCTIRLHDHDSSRSRYSMVPS
jgi:hypothetical protein